MASAPSVPPTPPVPPHGPDAPRVTDGPPPLPPAVFTPVVLAPPPPAPDERPTAGDSLPLPPPLFDPPAAVLSYLIPGLGQVYQGRVGKGLLFFFGLYTLFFYGMCMGQWRNVWLPDVSDLPPLEVVGKRLPGVPSALWYRPQFLAQFWVGAAAWPAVAQYAAFDPAKETGPVFGSFQRMPPEGGANDPPERVTLNKLQREGNKRWDLGWVYTVIAGVLNLLVIYDALAGPMYREPPPGWERKSGTGEKV